MSLCSIIGQPLAVELAQRWIARQTTHPLLLVGPEGVGKRTLALEVAKALNCAPERQRASAPELRSNLALSGAPVPWCSGAASAPRSPGALGRSSCDSCPSCRRIASGNHPDVRVIDLAWQAARRDELVEKQLNLRIETVLEERHRLLQSAVEGPWKVTLIDDVHRLTPDAANVLLKILEEPPARTALFLLTPFRDRLFATIISRCQPIRFRPLNDAEMREVLCRVRATDSTGADLSRLFELAQGSVGRALHLVREEEIQAAQDAEELWENRARLLPSDILRRAEGRGKAARPGRAEIEQKLRHLLSPAIRAMRAGDEDAAGAVRRVERAIRQLRQNVQPALVYENCLLQLAQEGRRPGGR
jgi:DNA polymerase-3 subunit delta'